jgi:hypothetical protein
MISINGIGDCQREKFRPFEKAPKKQMPVIFPVAIVDTDNKN